MEESTASAGEAILSPTTVSSLDGYSANPRFVELQKELRFVLTAGVTSLVASRAATPDFEKEAGEETVDQSRRGVPRKNLLGRLDLPEHVSTIKVVGYLQNWIKECAPFLDKFDVSQHFGVQVPLLAQNSPALLYAVLAFSARQAERKNSTHQSYDSLELYQRSIRLLSPSLQAREPSVIATVCILACLELMSGSPQDWKRHLEGCASLYACCGVNGFSGGLVQAVFWCYARMELCGAIISNGTKTTVLPLSEWVPRMSTVSVIESGSLAGNYEEYVKQLFIKASYACPDMYANWAVYLCTKACDMIHRRIKVLELGHNDRDERPFAEQCASLWSELEFWLMHRPSELLPVALIEGKNDQLFPQILFTHWSAISSNQLYHTACIILLEAKSLGQHILQSIPQHSIVWHAKRVCGISLTNSHLGSLVNAIQPLFIAGKHLSHFNEHLAVGRLLERIDKSTGWGALWRLRDLESIWGYDQHEIRSALRPS